MVIINRTNSSPAFSSLECFLLDINLDFSQHLFIAHILTTILNSVTSFTAAAGNSVVIVAVWRTPSLHTPSNTFLCCLALSDLTVGLIAQPCFVIHKIGELLQDYSMYCTTRIMTESLGYITAGTSVLIMAGIAIERYLALYLHLRYTEIVTTKRILFTASVLWMVCILLASSRLWMADDGVFNSILIPVISCCLVFTFLAYTRVLKYVRRHEKQINATSAALCPVNHQLSRIMRYKKSTLTMVYIVGIFVFCYIPFLCVKIVHKIEGYTISVKIAYLYASTIVFFNSSLNPLVYCWRITDIRRAVKALCLRCLGKKNSVAPLALAELRPRSCMSVSFDVTRRPSLSVACSQRKISGPCNFEGHIYNRT